MAVKPKGHSRDDALTPEELEAMMKLGPRDPLDRVLMALCIQLGLREGEAAHCQREWLSFQERKLRVPPSMPCALSPSGGPCVDCKKYDGEWSPKSKAGARTVPYRDLTGAADVLHPFFSLHEEVGLSRVSVWSRVRAMADRAGIAHRFYPHAGRATAATHFADMGLGEQDLCDVMGWDDLRTARPYIRRSGRNVEDAIARGKREGRSWV